MTFEEFIIARLPALLRFATALTGDPHRAEDVVQDALVKAQRRWRRIAGTQAPEAYLKRMITNEYLSWRRRRSSGEVPVTDGTLAAAGGPAADSADHHADRHVLWAMVRALAPKQRAALVLRYYEDLSYAEISGVLGCSEATARSHVSHALTILRVDVAGQSPDAAPLSRPAAKEA
ncbi:RNA polymerase sigma-70 factor, sigma-E family [Thermomonospora echinospora]|uniref:RNA polymerase sigma-70 factor, sigma-E family n=1 Tax=Thermomonospora echinospora TaxID=1992 RepID=A0A1H6DAL4_9ACTN|nr:SigE family RNA polymerase sigma factor [Thermomonospora echinospora]SEG82371.1 RNA polymerase sigma-70 factor, sigma-E family [Thermomonospora echinospora]